MQSFYCDICKKKIDNSMAGRNFFYYAEHSLCEACKDNLELQVRSAIRANDPYTITWYSKFIGDSISKAIQKGKV
ncbi:MAG: hypothetical protein LBC76_08565 [Treponema sp.]|jgi:hypothetical protein|nr:hypothetical protein [Treponema sp.]